MCADAARLFETGKCDDCETPLPLRAARQSELNSRWACAYCGTTYAAVLDESAPPGQLTFVSAVD